MKVPIRVLAVAAVLVSGSHSFADGDDEALGQFQEVLQSLSQNSFEMFKDMVDETDLRNRVLGHREIEPQSRAQFVENFWPIVESGFLEGLPPQGSEIKAKLIQFDFEGGEGTAIVRFSLPAYEFRYLVYTLRHDRRDRLKIVDWFDSNRGQLFSQGISDELITLVPTKATTRRLLTMSAPTDQQLFQVTEILKASRDNQPPRFFEIYDNFDEPLRREPIIANRAIFMAYAVKDLDRFSRALDIYAEIFADDTKRSLLVSNFYLLLEDVEKSYAALRRFQQSFSAKDGALPAKLSAMALALGQPDDAEKLAVEATTNEPTLELGWWSLLRARSSGENYAGAVEVLAHLEDDFGHRLDEAKLRRDKFNSFEALSESEEFREWRSARN